jgi:hypothetical protein
MEWIINRGSKLKNNNPINLDFNSLNTNLNFIVDYQFRNLKEKVKIDNNKYGFWQSTTNK